MTRGRTNEADQRKNFGGKPRPPARLSPAERTIWTETCRKQTPEWCDLAATGSLLEMYCVAVARYRLIHATCSALVAASEPTEGEALVTLADRLDKSGKLFNQLGLLESRIAALATKLRLTPQSRIRADRAGEEPQDPWGGHFPDDDDGDTG